MEQESIIKHKCEQLLLRASHFDASDLHLLPGEHQYKIMFRKYGQFIHAGELQSDVANRMISYFKFLSSLDISEKRKPQSGAFQKQLNKHYYSFRISTLPSAFQKESLAIRLLRQNYTLPIATLCYDTKTATELCQLVTQSQGLLLISGATGSGKTTSLYSLVQYCSNELSRHVISLEDPVESSQEQLLQIQVNERAGVTYATGLKAILRHSPDVIYTNMFKTFKISINTSNIKFYFERRGGFCLKNKFCVIQREVLTFDNTKETKIIMSIRFANSEIVYPHPITRFIEDILERRKFEINTIKAYAEDLKGFLNYIVEEEGDIGLKDIKIQHAINYLNFLNERIYLNQIGEYTYKRRAKVLEWFFKWLKDKDYLDEKLHSDVYANMFIENKMIIIKKNMFDHPEYGLVLAKEERTGNLLGSEVIHDFPNNRIEYMKTFLEFTLSVVPEIALGIALQFFGGLRKGEVVNLTIDAFPKTITNKDPYYIVIVLDRFDEIFENKISSVHEQVKVPRNQIVLNLGIAHEIYTLHLKRRNKIKTTSNAMFVSGKGTPICGQTYIKKFNYVKELFLDYMLIKDRRTYEYLTLHEWSSHFGRGVFTNFLLDDLGWDLEDVRLMRHDKRVDTTQIYRDKIVLINKAKTILDVIPKIMQQEDIDHLKNVSKMLRK
ncbi:hypothetical protein CSE16_13895 [Solibacillus sp. R5-41]|uniref:ATPase, T2SS/T4P/T4SS family n=1 Tax=Solibacillus sp. R5-41 TaxID=2048654 RepID=UPI000C125369|nr:ATPase, T2SS/T4P/T4SS family [Solibacillus sp. R5-41]ATP41054.1 hypothetical protein CSE16_13895 [Solibacillus sp. R5-41]